MKPLYLLSRLPRVALALPLLLLVSCPSGGDDHDSHEGHAHETGQEHDDAHKEDAADDHAGHDHDEEGSK